jgi:formylglycine-generating enzyme required for sulfatase activity
LLRSDLSMNVAELMPSRRQAILQILWLAGWTRTQRLFAFNPTPPPIEEQRFSVPLVDDAGQLISSNDASALYFVEELGGGVTLEMALIPRGDFAMGSDSPAVTRRPLEQPIHGVSINLFALGIFPVTRAQWRQVSTFPQVSRALHPLFASSLPPEVADRLPIDLVQWAEAVEFCSRLQQHARRPYRLPSEAEWEYACRAGTSTNYHFGDGISLQVANYNDGIVRPLTLTPVGSKQAPNQFGLHDMHGNVLEWCADWSHDTYDGAPLDGHPWTYGGDSFTRISRGGMYLWNRGVARSAARTNSDIRGTFSGQGFRVALDMSFELLDQRTQFQLRMWRRRDLQRRRF